MFSLASPHRGDSDKNTQHTIINIKKRKSEIIPNTIISAAMSFFLLGTQERVQNSRGKRAISVRAADVQLYYLSQVSASYGRDEICILFTHFSPPVSDERWRPCSRRPDLTVYIATPHPQPGTLASVMN